MTNKQIIIDGVDVSKCNKFDNGECLNPLETVLDCENSPNCLFKQLARKTQECERLKNERTVDLVKQLDQLKTENEILKEKLVISSNSDKKTLKIIQTLTEIKDIAEKSIEEGQMISGSWLYQKISEVEDV